VKAILKTITFGFATIGVAPALASYAIRSAFLGRDRALQGSSQALSLVPGVLGQYLRRAFYCRVLDECHPSVTIEFGVLLSKVAVRLEPNVYVGPRCDLGHVHLERDVLLASGVIVPSGPDTHGTALLDRPIREQPGRMRTVRIGAGSWIGSGAIVMADVGRDSVVAAGAVVTESVPDRVIAAGIPARVIRERVTGQVIA
jgi:virginiamycin A acetyltransferase